VTAPARLICEGFPALLPQDRAPGRHLSDVTRSICAGLGDFDPDGDPPIQLMRLGLTMEWGLTNQLNHQYPDRYFKTWDLALKVWKFGLQVEKDGIWANLDLLNLGEEPGVAIVEDVKMTRKSKRHGHDDVVPDGHGGEQVVWGPKWREAWMRLAGYCWMVGARVGRLWVAHIFDYSERGGGDACCWVWERRWDTAEGEKELEQNWNVIVRHEKTMPPPTMGGF
jgi:hypothetical protein